MGEMQPKKTKIFFGSLKFEIVESSQSHMYRERGRERERDVSEN